MLVSLSTRKVYRNASWKQRRPRQFTPTPIQSPTCWWSVLRYVNVTSSCLVNKASAFDNDASRASSALYELDSWTRVRGRACVPYVHALNEHMYKSGVKYTRQLASYKARMACETLVPCDATRPCRWYGTPGGRWLEW